MDVGVAVVSGQLAKCVSVGLGGVGEDLGLCVLGWRGGEVVVVLRLVDFSGGWVGVFGRVVEAACVVRRGWGVEGFSVVGEGFCGVGGGLVGRFGGGDLGVRECLVVLHLGLGGLPVWVVVPFVYGLGRRVVFGCVRRVLGVGGRERFLVDGLGVALGVDVVGGVGDVGVFRGVLVDGLEGLGFVVSVVGG